MIGENYIVTIFLLINFSVLREKNRDDHYGHPDLCLIHSLATDDFEIGI